MSPQQIQDAIRQMMGLCKSQENYTPVSARGLLSNLRYSPDETEEVLSYLDKNGFNYCLDPKYGNKAPRTACYWGPDQLESRLAFVI